MDDDMIFRELAYDEQLREAMHEADEQPPLANVQYEQEAGRLAEVVPSKVSISASSSKLALIMADLEKHIITTEGGSYLLDFYEVQRILSHYLVE